MALVKNKECLINHAFWQVPKWLTDILNMSNIGIDIIDSKYRLIYLNPEWKKIYGEVGNKRCFEYFMDRRTPCPDCKIPAALTTKSVTVADHILPHEKNKVIQVTTLPFKIPGGEWVAAEVNVDVSDRKRAEDRFRRMNECFLNFTTDPLDNINRLTKLCGELLGADCALYNRLEKGMLCSWGMWNAPRGYKAADKPKGHICYDLIESRSKDVLIIRDLKNTKYAKTDLNVKRYRLGTYVGAAVAFGRNRVGSLCVVFKRDYSPKEDDVNLLKAIAAAIGIEEQRKASEEALAGSESKFRSIAEHSAVGICMHQDGKVIYANKFLADIFGYKIEDAMGKKLINFVSPQDRQKVTTNVRNKLSGKHSMYSYEFKGLKKDGKEFDLETFSGPPFILNGKVTILATMYDITERKKVENLIKEKERFLSNLFSSIQDGISILDTDMRIMRVNSIMERWYKHAMPLVGKKCYKAYHGRNARCEICPTYQTLKTGRAAYEVVPKRGPHGKITGWLDLYSFPVFDPDSGKLMAVIEYVRDISKRKEFEIKLRESEERYRTLAESAQDYIFMIGKDLKIEYANSACGREVSVTPHALIGKRLVDVFRPEIAKRQTTNLKRVFATGKPYHGEDKTQFPNRILWLDTWLVPLKDEKGEISSVLGISRNITERKKAAEVLQRDKETFEKLVDERTKELVEAHSKLEKAKRLSDLGSLAAIVAHELRSPLAAIRMAAYNIKKKSKDPLLFAHLLNVEKKVLESDQIISNLLTYAKIKEPHYQPIDIHDVLNECILNARDRYPEYSVLVKKFYCKRCGLIKADPIYTKEIFDNILNNAYESFSKKKGRISVKTRLDRNRTIKIGFHDNGMGIDIKNMPNISEPFFTTKVRGMGLGLAVCNQLVKLHDGKLEVTSQKGKGTTVEIAIPTGGKKS